MKIGVPEVSPRENGSQEQASSEDGPAEPDVSEVRSKKAGVRQIAAGKVSAFAFANSLLTLLMDRIHHEWDCAFSLAPGFISFSCPAYEEEGHRQELGILPFARSG